MVDSSDPQVAKSTIEAIAKGYAPKIPHWWNTNHQTKVIKGNKELFVDSTEFLSLPDFQDRLKRVGDNYFYVGSEKQQAQGFIPKPTVDLPLVIDGFEYHFLLSARPLHPAEYNMPLVSQKQLEKKVRENELFLRPSDMPYIAGFFGGKKGSLLPFHRIDTSYLFDHHQEFLTDLEIAIQDSDVIGVEDAPFQPSLVRLEGTPSSVVERELKPLLISDKLIERSKVQRAYNTFLFSKRSHSTHPQKKKQSILVQENKPVFVTLDELTDAYLDNQENPDNHYIAVIPCKLPDSYFTHLEHMYAPIVFSTIRPLGEHKPALFNYGLFHSVNDYFNPSHLQFSPFLMDDEKSVKKREDEIYTLRKRQKRKKNFDITLQAKPNVTFAQDISADIRSKISSEKELFPSVKTVMLYKKNNSYVVL